MGNDRRDHWINLNPARTTKYFGSHTGYSWPAQFITWGALPWALFAGTQLPVDAPGWIGWVWYSLIFPPLILWFIGKAAGPERIPWFYRRPGICDFAPDGVHWHTEMPFARRRDVFIPWPDVVRLERGYIHLRVVGRTRAVTTRVPADVTRLKPAAAREDWSFAQALVAYRPDSYVLTDPTIDGQPAGARMRDDREPASVVTPRPLSRSPQITMAVFGAIVFTISLVEGLLRH